VDSKLEAQLAAAQAEINEALQLAGGPGTLKELAAAALESQRRLGEALFALQLVRWFGSHGEIDGDICGKPELNGKSVSHFVEHAIAAANVKE
jgi:hypothetical protein